MQSVEAGKTRTTLRARGGRGGATAAYCEEGRAEKQVEKGDGDERASLAGAAVRRGQLPMRAHARHYKER
eukprot:2683669-Pyramimonas_sp.AAC.1